MFYERIFNLMMSKEIKQILMEKLYAISFNDITEYPLSSGRSGAEVYRIKVKSRRSRLSGNYIVKICDAVNDTSASETSKAKQLFDYSHSFSKHLVRVVASVVLGSNNIIIYSYANNSVITSVAFSRLDESLVEERVKDVSFDLLSSLNNEIIYGESLKDFFECLLSKQLGEQGRFAKRMEDLLNKPNSQCIVLNGKILPNPLYFMRNLSKLNSFTEDAILFKGIIHGDLHGENLLISDNAYSIIDYDSVSLDSYLFFDHAYFELSVFLDNSQDNDLKKWNKMLERYIAPSIFDKAEPSDYFLEYLVRNAVCDGILKWIKSKELDSSRDDIELQFMAARVAAGINFFCKKSCTGITKQCKYLFYIAFCLNLLLEKIGYELDKNDISTINNLDEGTTDEKLWEDFISYVHYVKILITDGDYPSCDLDGLCKLNWSMVIDINEEQANLNTYQFFLNNSTTKSVKKINVVADEEAEVFDTTLNFLILRKAVNVNYHTLWRHYRKNIINNLNRLLFTYPQVSVIFVFDCSGNSVPFRNKMMNDLCNINLPYGTRFISLHSYFSDDLNEEIPEIEIEKKWRFIAYAGIDLKNVAKTCNIYLNDMQKFKQQANLPALQGDKCTLEKEDLIYYSSSIEIIYDGCQYQDLETELSGFDVSGKGDSFGENFYKGNEITWNDISLHRDLPLMDEKKYDALLNRLCWLAEEKSPRIKLTKLIHGAGTGGTTLSKRILWDMKGRFPCTVLKKYTSKTAEMLLGIYQKTGKCVLLSIETGSTIITDEELNKMIKEIDSQNGKLVIILISRKDNNSDNEEEGSENTTLATLSNTMQTNIAEKFKYFFSKYAENKSDSDERKNWLEKITGNDNYLEQRSPFFYGFYAFQEEYNLIERLTRTVSECNNLEKDLLNSLALITFFSQNVCMKFSEMRSILQINDNDNKAPNVFMLMEKLPTALTKLIVFRDNGLRLCHKVIAQKVLVIIHGPNIKFAEVVYPAAKEYIQSLSNMYDDNNEYVDNVLKELIIDRAYIDSEEKKTKFSPLVESISLWTDKKALFDFLISKFPNNPHYYNHLARLLAAGDNENKISPQYKDAVNEAKHAVEIASVATSTHNTTLGCIYGQWILKDIKNEVKNKRNNRYSSDCCSLITDISVRYNLARQQFEEARLNSDTYDSFSYFPQINLECEIILHLSELDNESDIGQILQHNTAFREWYEEHFSIATELILKMKEQLGDKANFLAEAQRKLKLISHSSVEAVNQELTDSLNNDAISSKRMRRSLVHLAYSLNGFNWNKANTETITLAEQCVRKNIEMGDEIQHKSFDIETWFELYRRTNYFDASVAQSMIADYMTESYRKNYLLLLVTFIMYKRGVSSVSTETIIRLISETNRTARQHGLNTAREHDVYIIETDCCPIVSVADVERRKGSPIKLEEFTGIITEVDQTHGKILLDKFNLDVTFIPNPVSADAETFSRKDINSRVKLNLMFSYSGLRGWKVIKQNPEALND